MQLLTQVAYLFKLSFSPVSMRYLKHTLKVVSNKLVAALKKPHTGQSERAHQRGAGCVCHRSVAVTDTDLFKPTQSANIIPHAINAEALPEEENIRGRVLLLTPAACVCVCVCARCSMSLFNVCSWFPAACCRHDVSADIQRDRAQHLPNWPLWTC